VSDIERNNLDAHVSLCELRYLNLERRIDQLEVSLASLQTLVLEIRDCLAQLPQQQNLVQAQRWERFQWAVIGILTSVAAWALSQVLA